MMSSKIGWCDITRNPVWGCLNNCEYCYARKIAKRFWKNIYKKEFQFHVKQHPTWAWTGDNLSGLKDFKPTWLESNFQKKFPKKPSRIFIDSMSDVSYWQHDWMIKVIDKIKMYPQHKFLFLTKNPRVYDKYNFPGNCWLGTTMVHQAKIFELALKNIFFKNKNKTFFSIEPIQNEIQLIGLPDWVIVGAETGNRKNKIIPQRSWIESLLQQCRENHIPIFMKDNLKHVWKDKLIQEFPG
jgi:protein gp37